MSDALTPPDALPLREGWRDELARYYATPPRHYHTIQHVRRVARHVKDNGPWDHPAEVFAAALFHDAIYESGRKDNEKRSAELAVSTLPRWTDADLDLDRVAELIELTALHSQLSPDDVDDEAARFLDCDMVILAAPQNEYDAYVAGVAAEYDHLDDTVYRMGRAAFVQGLLAGERIFLSDSFHEAHEEAARANLRRELKDLLS